MLVCVMFISAILVLRRLDLTRGKLEAEEVGPIAPAVLETPEESVEPLLAEDLGKEDNE
jgi:hypothetical protein